MPESINAGLPKQQAPPPRASSGQLQYGYPKVQIIINNFVLFSFEK